MKTSSFKSIAMFAAVCLLSANVALAKNGGNGNGGNKSSGGGNSGNKSNSSGGNKSAFKINLGGLGGPGNLNHGNNGNGNGNCHGNNNNNNCNNGGYNNGNCNYNNGPYGQNQNYFGQAYEPFHSSYVTLPGDSFYTVSLKEYGTSSNSRYIAQFNRMQQNAALVPGQTLMLPSISPNGTLSMSRAPGAESLQNTPFNSSVSNFGTSPSGVTSNFGSSNFAKTSFPTTNFAKTTAPVVEAPRPTVTVGSTLMVDGQTFGDKQGVARLRVSGLSLPIEVVEWTTSSVKIHLPTVELTGATKADIEVVRADGSLASKSAVELGTATEVASTK